MARRVDFFDGATTGTVPTIGNIVASDLVTYPDDATYEATEDGAPAEGNIYFNTTSKTIRYYNGTQWEDVVDESATQTLQNKTIDGTDATGTNTVSIDATDASYDNTTSAMTATDVQAAIDEVEGRVDTAEADISNLETLSGEAGGTNHGTFTGTTIPDSSTTHGALQALETEVELKEDSANKGVANGYASLDAGGKIPSAQLPSTVMEYQGTWSAATNTPTLADGVGDAGDVYVTNAAGTQDLGSGNITFAVGDWVLYNGSTWEKSENSDSVTPSNTVTLTNKTIDADNNTISNLAHGAEVDNPSSGVHGVTGNVVGTTDTQDLSAKTFTDPITLEEQVSTPSTPATGDKKLYPKSDGKLYTLDDGGVEVEIGAGSGTLTIASKAAAYTTLTTDDVILCDASGGAFTITLHTASGNTGDQIMIKKTDSDVTEPVTIDGDGTETIDGVTTQLLYDQNESVTLVSDGTNWQILSKIRPALKSRVRLQGTNGAGSTGNAIRRFTNTIENIGSDIVYTDSATQGASFQVKVPGMYTVIYSDAQNGACLIGLSLNSSATSTAIGSLANAERLVVANPRNADQAFCVTWTGFLDVDDIIRPHNSTSVTNPTNGNRTNFTIARVD